MAFVNVMLLGPCIHLASQLHFTWDVVLPRRVQDIIKGWEKLLVLLFALACGSKVCLVRIVSIIVIMIWLRLWPLTLTALWIVLWARIFAFNRNFRQFIVTLTFTIIAAISDAVSVCQSLFVLSFQSDSFFWLFDRIIFFYFFLAYTRLLFDPLLVLFLVLHEV